jgi:predicted outer membrane repeat protein
MKRRYGLLAATALLLLALLTVGVSSGVGDTYKCMVINDRLNTTYKPRLENWNALQAAIDAAGPGDTLWVRGYCSGSIEITKSLTLTGQKIAGFYFAPQIVGENAPLAGQSAVRVIGSDVQVQINSLTITNGGAARVAAERGGGIYNDHASLALDNVTLTGNAADSGGAIYNDHGTVELTNSTVDGNFAPRGGDGAGITTVGGSLTVNASTITNNLYADRGGGIYALSATVVVNGSEIANNWYGQLPTQGGGIYANRDMSQGGTPYSTVTLTDTKLHDHKASSYGGGILAPGCTVTLTGTSEVSENEAGRYGGGAWAGNLIVSGDATIHGNTAGELGGGVYVSDLSLSGNAKIYGNSVSSWGHGGGIYASYAHHLTGCLAGTEGDEGVNVFSNTPDDIYTSSP